jgi:hypothetical protein
MGHLAIVDLKLFIGKPLMEVEVRQGGAARS